VSSRWRGSVLVVPSGLAKQGERRDGGCICSTAVLNLRGAPVAVPRMPGLISADALSTIRPHSCAPHPPLIYHTS
jgi:hypothetical protein